MNLTDKYKEINKQLDVLLMKTLGRCDRNNLDVKNLNPPVLLQTLAILELSEKIDNLCSILLNQTQEKQKTSTKRTPTSTK